jgi:poly [ADP-ribose] polymerase
VGAAGATKTYDTGAHGYETLLRQKLGKGYRKLDLADDQNSAPKRVANTMLAAEAKAGLTSGAARTNTDIEALIERIVRVNAHDIELASGGLMKVDTSGRIKTPLGIVTGRSIDQAAAVLNQIEAAAPSALPDLLERYLTFVPQKVGSRAGWADRFFTAENTVASQRDFLDQLRDSLNFFDAAQAAAAKAPADKSTVETLFKYKIRAVATGGQKFKRIEKLYEGSKNSMHSASRLKLKRVFELVDPIGAAKYAEIAAEIGNEQELWHGTKAVNLLSILRKGLYVPPVSGSTVQIAGRMFGDGVYLSSQSSKSLGYATGLWGGGRESNCFMLLNDVAMGSEYRPNRQGFDRAIPSEARNSLNKFGKHFNSINIKAGTCGVRNAESVVWNVDAVRVRYLCEFDS